MSEITQLLGEVRAGDGDAWNRVVALLYDDLRRLAQRVSAGAHSLNATALVHECWLRFADAGRMLVVDALARLGDKPDCRAGRIAQARQVAVLSH